MFRAACTAMTCAILLATASPASANAFFDAEAHMQAMDAIAAIPPWAGGTPHDDEGYYGYDEPASYTGTEWALWSHDLQLEEVRRQYGKKNDEAYRAFAGGEWLHRTPDTGAKDQACSAMYLRQGVGVILMATGGMNDPVLLGFFSLDTPKPVTPGFAKATLTQTGGDPAATVEVYNARLPWAPDFGLVFFAVPSASLLVDNILDTHAFSIAMSGKEIAAVEWTGGHAARDKLKTCIAGRP